MEIFVRSVTSVKIIIAAAVKVVILRAGVEVTSRVRSSDVRVSALGVSVMVVYVIGI